MSQCGNTLKKMNQSKIRFGKRRQILKFVSSLTDVSTTVIESPTAAEMSQPKTISHKVFPIPHYLTTWPTPDYLTIGWPDGGSCKARGGSLIIPLTDWPLLACTTPSWLVCTSDDWHVPLAYSVQCSAWCSAPVQHPSGWVCHIFVERAD